MYFYGSFEKKEKKFFAQKNPKHNQKLYKSLWNWNYNNKSKGRLMHNKKIYIFSFFICINKKNAFKLEFFYFLLECIFLVGVASFLKM